QERQNRARAVPGEDQSRHAEEERLRHRRQGSRVERRPEPAEHDGAGEGVSVKSSARISLQAAGRAGELSMTEADWLTSTDPLGMLNLVRGKAAERKLRLFAVACCRRIWHLFSDRRAWRAIEFAERYADGLATKGSCTIVLGDGRIKERALFA